MVAELDGVFLPWWERVARVASEQLNRLREA
jgi:hypothetical protein